MKRNLIKDENYINIQGWMVNKLNLSGNELIIYALIYGFSQLENHTFQGSLQYICEWTNISKTSCISNLKKLVDKKLIIKKEKEINGIKFCEYYASLNTIQETLIPIQETLINNIDNNIDNTNIINNICINNVENENESKKEELKLIDNDNINKEKENKEEKILNENIKCIIDYLNESISSKYKYNNKTTIKLIKARFKDGYKLDDFYDVIDKKVKDWFNSEMQKYLRPETLFGNKFENYLNQKTFAGKSKFSYSAKPTFDNTANHDVPKGIASMTEEEKEDFIENELAKDENGNFLKF